MELMHRAATRDDTPRLVDFVLMAGEGLPDLAWAAMAEPGESPRDVGLRRAARDEGSFSWRNGTVFEREGKVVAGLVGFPLPDEPVEIGADFPPAFRPLQELENLACGTWYVNILGVDDGLRGQGIGGCMLALAERKATELGARGTSIIAFSSNPGAVRLYRRSGYLETARRTLALSGWQHDGCEAILLVKAD